MSHPSDSKNFLDLSGLPTSSTTDGGNPYNALIEACNNDPALISARYSTHRSLRNNQQRAKLLAPEFQRFNTDPVLAFLLDDEKVRQGYEDPRHCLVFWARPTEWVRGIVDMVQRRLSAEFPSLWLMPLDNLHMTVLEIAHSRTKEEIDGMVAAMSDHVPGIVNFIHDAEKEVVLEQPMVGYDDAAVALGFVPAASERGGEFDGAYTYHHLRRDIYDLCEKSGVEVASRYVVPSAHLTIGRWVDQEAVKEGRVGRLVQSLEEVNEELRTRYGGVGQKNGRWTVGEEKGLVCRVGQVWYGGGESCAEGRPLEESSVQKRK